MQKALIVVDVQEGFLNDRNRWIIPHIQKLLRDGGYDLYIEAIFHAEPGSLWDTQVHWTFPLQPTIPEIEKWLPADTVRVTKMTKSVFKGDVDVTGLLKSKSIEEVHIVGVDTQDCVLATAQEAFDLGFYTCVIEECTESSESSVLREYALGILRHLRMTNHS